MLIGVLKEIKTRENRVAMVPAGVEQMRAHGHDVMVETATPFRRIYDAERIDAQLDTALLLMRVKLLGELHPTLATANVEPAEMPRRP